MVATTAAAARSGSGALDPLIAPASIAVIGASNSPT
jgi:hypothetical protein